MLKVLFLCTQNSARSQIAEALLNLKGKDRVAAYSAGSEPAKRINPIVVNALQEFGVDVSSKKPKPIETFLNQPFDFVITLCEKARSQCPTFPGNALRTHWNLDDPDYFEGSEEEKLEQVRRIIAELDTKIGLFLSLPLEKSDRTFLQQKLNAISKTD